MTRLGAGRRAACPGSPEQYAGPAQLAADRVGVLAPGQAIEQRVGLRLGDPTRRDGLVKAAASVLEPQRHRHLFAILRCGGGDPGPLLLDSTWRRWTGAAVAVRSLVPISSHAGTLSRHYVLFNTRCPCQ